jgi:hypothetical protein
METEKINSQKFIPKQTQKVADALGALKLI